MSWFSRLTNALNPGRLDKELADEMADHVKRRAAAFEEAGVDRE